jgi:hypothetical protein
MEMEVMWKSVSGIPLILCIWENDGKETRKILSIYIYIYKPKGNKKT